MTTRAHLSHLETPCIELLKFNLLRGKGLGRLLRLAKRLHVLSMTERMAYEVEERCEALKSGRFAPNDAPSTEHMEQEVRLCEAMKELPLVTNESSEINPA